MLFAKNKNSARLCGGWEERGVIGTRIEIDDAKVTVLWRGAPVLETKYKIEQAEDGTLRLILEKTGLRYQNDVKDYASIEELYEKDGKLVFVENFPISGISRSELTKTENNRYGNYDVVTDDFIKALRGTWKDEKGWFTLTFDKTTVTANDRKTRYVVLSSRSGGGLKITDENPSVDHIAGLINLEFAGDRIYATLPVCDAPSTTVVLIKQ